MKKIIIFILTFTLLTCAIYPNPIAGIVKIGKPAWNFVYNNADKIFNILPFISDIINNNSNKEIERLNLYIKNKQKDEAVDLFYKLISEKKLKGDDVLLSYYIAIAQICETFDETISYLDTAIDSYPNSKYIESAYYLKYLYTGLKHIKSKNYKQSILQLSKSLQFFSDSELALYWLGYSYCMNSQYEEAINSLLKALKLNSNDEYTWYWLGYSYYKINDYNEALEVFMKAKKLNSNNQWIWYWLGNTYKKLNDKEKAKVAYEKALEIEPEFKEAKKAINNLNSYPYIYIIFIIMLPIIIILFIILIKIKRKNKTT